MPKKPTESKASADYENVSTHTGERCYICNMFLAQEDDTKYGGCTTVKGKISPAGWCKWYELDLRFDFDYNNRPHPTPPQSTVDQTGAGVAKGSQPMDGMNMFLPLTKVDAVNQLVYGIATEETPDAVGEILDYMKSKPYFEEWSANISKATNGASLGNLRAMHSKVAAGKLTEITFNDPSRRIEICAKVVDPNEWLKVKEGVYTGFSIGGNYKSRVTDPGNPALKRYVADPTEISLVDLPCLPTATFQLIKSNGPAQEVEIRPFKTMSSPVEILQAFEKFHRGEYEELLQKGLAEEAASVGPDDHVGSPAGGNTRIPPGTEPDLETEGSEGGDITPPATPRTAHVDPGQRNRKDPVGDGELPSNSDEHVGDPGGSKSGTAGGSVTLKTQETETDPNEAEKAGMPPAVRAKLEQDKKGKGGGSGSKSEADKEDEDQDEVEEAHGEGGSATKASTTTTTVEVEKIVNVETPTVVQVWLARDGKPFTKKTEALAHNEELDSAEMAKSILSPTEAAIAALTTALDRVDGGTVKISDANAYDAAWQAAQKGTQTRAGAQPLGKVYNSTDDIPPAVKQHFKDANKQRQWMHVWNNVFKESGDEQKAFSQAWAAAEKAYTDEDVEKASQRVKAKYGDVKYADPGYQKDKKKRYPVDTEKHIRAAWSYIHMPKNAAKYGRGQADSIKGNIAAAWKDVIGGEPPAAGKIQGSAFIKMLGEGLSKHLYDVGDVACMILRMNDMVQCLEMEAVREGDSMQVAAELRANVASMCEFLRALVIEETEELVMGTEDLTGHDDDDDDGVALQILVRSAVGPNAKHLAKVFREAFGDYEDAQETAAKEAGAKYNKTPGYRLIEALEKVGSRLGQVNRMHLQAAHDHISSMTDGECCDEPDHEKWTKAGAKLSKAVKEKLQASHDHMADLGADCSMGKGAFFMATSSEVSAFEKSRGLGGGHLQKAIQERDAFKKALDQVGPTLKALTERIQKLEDTPEPVRRRVYQPGETGNGSVPETGQAHARTLEKGRDVLTDNFQYGGDFGKAAIDKFSEYLATLSPDQRALEMIKLAQRNPTLVIPDNPAWPLR